MEKYVDNKLKINRNQIENQWEINGKKLKINCRRMENK